MQLITFLKGKKTYIVATLLVIVAGLQAQGYIDTQTSDAIKWLLVGSGFAALRAGMSDK